MGEEGVHVREGLLEVLAQLRHDLLVVYCLRVWGVSNARLRPETPWPWKTNDEDGKSKQRQEGCCHDDREEDHGKHDRGDNRRHHEERDRAWDA